MEFSVLPQGGGGIDTNGAEGGYGGARDSDGEQQSCCRSFDAEVECRHSVE